MEERKFEQPQEEIQNVEEQSKDVSIVEQKYVPQVASMWNNTKMFNLSYKLAGFLASSDIIPQAYQNKIGNCIVAMDIANRMGVSPMFVMQNSQVVRGKFSWSGSSCKSMIDCCGKYRSTRYVEVGQRGTDTFGFYLEATDKFGDVVKGTVVDVAMAKAEGWYGQNPKWRTMTELMLKYRCAAFFMRTECPSISMGFLTSEENEDIVYKDSEKSSVSKMIDEEQSGEK